MSTVLPAGVLISTVVCVVGRCTESATERSKTFNVELEPVNVRVDPPEEYFASPVDGSVDQLAASDCNALVTAENESGELAVAEYTEPWPL
jgi:hypothetical protein